jgi:hypothetical protein
MREVTEADTQGEETVTSRARCVSVSLTQLFGTLSPTIVTQNTKLICPFR